MGWYSSDDFTLSLGVLVTIDPGSETGWALWGHHLTACGLGDPRSSETHIAERVHEVWIEAPVIYPRSKARPADLMKLSREAGRWAGIYSMLGVEASYVEPARWKGQLDKAVHHPRIWAALSEDERAIVSRAVGLAGAKAHNVLDAVGLGLWVLKRTGRQ